jgi:NAD(P)-dependent dehydrogenase (short-subunit alcohol dehydrogenase family)
MPAVLVTGAAKGIGEACVLRLAQHGHQVFAGVRRAQDGAALRARAAGIVPVLLDVTDASQIAAAATLLEQQTGQRGLAGVVNNAGIAVAGPLEFLPLSELRKQFEVNVIGQLAVTQALLPLLRKARGRVVNIGSVSGRSALPMTGAYAASKHALEALSDALRVELMPWGLHVALVEPGVIATPIWQTSIAAAEHTMEGLPARGLEYYGAILDALKENVGSNAQSGLPPDRVARVVQHALFSPRPHTRYVVGRDARLRLLLEKLPDRWRDHLIRRRLDRMQKKQAIGDRR